MPATRRKRSTLPKAEARQRYIEMGELMVLEQIARDAATLDQGALAVGPFARLDAEAVAARAGKTRGAINNLFGSQAAYQTETMTLVLDSSDWMERIEYPAPAKYATEDSLANSWPVSPIAIICSAKIAWSTTYNPASTIIKSWTLVACKVIATLWR